MFSAKKLIKLKYSKLIKDNFKRYLRFHTYFFIKKSVRSKTDFYRVLDRIEPKTEKMNIKTRRPDRLIRSGPVRVRSGVVRSIFSVRTDL